MTAGTREAPARNRTWTFAAVAALATVPGLVARLAGLELPEPVLALLYGTAIVGAAFLLSWAAEAAQVDLSAGLAIAILAFIAVLPEYAVDLVFAIQGGEAYAQHGEACAPPGAEGETPCALALANMTGANRILIGIGWSLIVLLAAYRIRRGATVGEVGSGSGDGEKVSGVDLPRAEAVPVAFLLLASLYALHLPLKDSITLVDFAVLVAIFVAYTVRVAKAPAEEPHLVGPAAWIGHQGKRGRRTWVAVFFVVAGLVILAVAEPFAEALVASGEALGVDEFFLVQWVAPLASEAPELLIAALFAWRLLTSEALATLISSKVNQWTLLVGTLPLVFSFAAGSAVGLPVDELQRDELLITAAQSLFAVSLLVQLRLSVRGALALLGLFLAQFALSFVVPEEYTGVELVVLSAVYLLLAVVLFVRRRRDVATLLRDGFRTPFSQLGGVDADR